MCVCVVSVNTLHACCLSFFLCLFYYIRANVAVKSALSTVENRVLVIFVTTDGVEVVDIVVVVVAVATTVVAGAAATAAVVAGVVVTVANSLTSHRLILCPDTVDV